MRRQPRYPVASRASQQQQIDGLLTQSVRLDQVGRLFEARQLLRRALELDPGNVAALTQLGLLEIKAGDLLAAEPSFEEAVKREPKAADLRANLAMLYLKLGRPDKAWHQAKLCDKYSKKSFRAAKALFECAYELGRLDDARAFAEHGLALKKNDPELTMGLAQTLDLAGRPHEAAELYRSVIASGHESAFALDGIARSETFSSEPPEYARMTAMLSDPKVGARDKLWLHSALGKIDDDLGRYDRAFAHFSAVPQMERRGANEVRAFEREISFMKEVFTRDFFEARRLLADDSARPVFVIGMPRSGTTLVEQIIASHPQGAGAGEQRFFRIELDRQFPRDRASSAFADAVRGWPAERARTRASEYLALLDAYGASAARVVDKAPDNLERLWLLALLFPQATFIHCRRDPIATCVSCFVNTLGPVRTYPGDLVTLGRYYRLCDELVAFWRSVLPVRLFEVHYESLVVDPEAQVRQLIEATGLTWNDACLDFHKLRRAIRTPSRRQVEQPIHARAVNDWQRYRDHLGPLFEALRESVPNAPA